MSRTVPSKNALTWGLRRVFSVLGEGGSAVTLATSQDEFPRPVSRFDKLSAMIRLILQGLTLPFRLLGSTIQGIGRLSSILLGFLLMVGGAALLASPLVLIGLPMFLFGLVLTLRALD